MPNDKGNFCRFAEPLSTYLPFVKYSIWDFQGNLTGCGVYVPYIIALS